MSGHRVLIVDVNIDNAQSLSILLGTMGNEVCTAYDGLQALEMVPRFHPDIVLLDIGLPKLDGYEVARGIRQRHGNENILLVALTGWGQSEARRRSQEAGFDCHLVKPIDLEDMKKIKKLYTRGVCGNRK